MCILNYRIINILKYWIEHFFEDFERHEPLLQKLNSFLLKNVENPEYEHAFTILIAGIKRKVRL
jgi:hypothetical protein